MAAAAEKYLMTTPEDGSDYALRITGAFSDGAAYRLDAIDHPDGAYVFSVWARAESAMNVRITALGVTGVHEIGTSWERLVLRIAQASGNSVDIAPGGDQALYLYKAMLENGTAPTGWVSAEEDTTDRLHSDILDVERDGLRVTVPDKDVYWQVNDAEAGWYYTDTNGGTKCFAAIGVDTDTDEGYLAANRLQDPSGEYPEHIATKFGAMTDGPGLAGNAVQIINRVKDYTGVTAQLGDWQSGDGYLDALTIASYNGESWDGTQNLNDAHTLINAKGEVYYSCTNENPQSNIYMSGDMVHIRMQPGIGNLQLYAAGEGGVQPVSIANGATPSGNACWIVQGHFTPASTAAYNLGNGDYRWNRLYTSNSVSVSSDRRIKDEISDIDGALRFVMAQRARQYRIRDDPGKLHYGFVAQEVAEALGDAGRDPETFGGYDGEDPGHLALCYEEFIAPLYAVVQGQQRQIEKLESQILDLNEKE